MADMLDEEAAGSLLGRLPGSSSSRSRVFVWDRMAQYATHLFLLLLLALGGVVLLSASIHCYVPQITEPELASGTISPYPFGENWSFITDICAHQVHTSRFVFLLVV
jgi:hypothetical protein